MWQLICGVAHLHAAHVLHRDLKPANVLVNADCTLRICDLGMARRFGSAPEEEGLTVYVATRWYRAPEVILSHRYTEALDIWSVACILAELLLGRPLFPGSSYVDQIAKIVALQGPPSARQLAALASDNPAAEQWLRSLPVPPHGGQLRAHFPPTTSEGALDMLQAMLAWDPVPPHPPPPHLTV